MYSLKGFMLVQPFSNNVPGQLSPIGEISNYSKTFSRDVGHYSMTEYPAVDFLAFSSVNVTETTKTPTVADNDQISKLLEIGQWMFSQSAGGLFDANAGGVVTALLSEFSSDIEELQVGQMVQGPGNSWLPSWISYSFRHSAEENRIRVWFADDAFRRQYDEYHITIVPPIEDIDLLLGMPVVVKAHLDAVSPTERQRRIETAKDSHPDTLTRIESFPWNNPIDPNITLNPLWGIVIYGPAGNNIDNIRLALSTFILANSNRPRSDWESFIPDLFVSTEFIIVPMWDNYSIPNQTHVTGLYSPTVKTKELVDKLSLVAPDYPVPHIQDNIATSVTTYKSISFMSVGSPNNRDGITDFKGRFPDYTIIPSTSVEYSRMSPATQNFILLLNRMIQTAENMSEFSDIPVDMSRLIRDGVLFVTASFDDIQYLILSRKSYDEIILGLAEDDD
jgi:hypothetical protein